MSAENEVGLMYEKGEGVRCPVCRAWGWYMMAAKPGYPHAEKALKKISGNVVALDDLKDEV